MARKHGLKVEAVESIKYRAEQHSIGGMPHCRHCGGRFSSMGVLRTHIVTNACGWRSLSQRPTGDKPDAPGGPQAESRETASTAPEQSILPAANMAHSALKMPHPAEAQHEILANTQQRPAQLSRHHTCAPCAGQADASDMTDSHLRQPNDVASSTGQRLIQQRALPESKAQEHSASLFADTDTRALARSSSNLIRIAEDHAGRLKHHCLICDHWVADLNTVKTHILRSHPVAWHKCNPTISRATECLRKH